MSTEEPATGVDVALAGFARSARAAGLPVTVDRSAAFLTATALVGAEQPAGVYWSGRATLCADPDHIELFDRVFAAWFGGSLPTAGRRRRPAARASERAPLEDPAARGSDAPGEKHVVRALASAEDILRHRDVAELSPAEAARLGGMFDRLRPALPERSSPRRRPARTGDVDARHTVREQLRRLGEPGVVRRRRPGQRRRPVVVLVDVSGSMSAYAEALLRLAHRLVRAGASGAGRVEVFTIGTRLTRVTRPLQHRDVERALAALGDVVPDWSGGTRLGEVLKAFTDRWGQRGTARGAVVVICSDGWERGDPELLREQVARLRRLAHHVVWVNPHSGKPGYLPVQGGITAVLPHLDHLLAGHTLGTYADLLEVIRRA